MKTSYLTPIRAGLAGMALLAGMLLPVSAVQAQSNPAYYRSFDATVYPSAAPLKLWMIVDKTNLPRKSLKVEVIDAENRVMHTHNLPANVPKIRQQFDMSDLTNGTYTIRISDGKDVIEKTFKLKTSALQEQLPQRYMTMN